MVLDNINILGTDEISAIQVINGKISTIGRNSTGFQITRKELCLSFTNAIAFPGLINSHDHLDFNLFPQLGNRIYNNYAEWGNDINKNNKTEIDAVLKIPLQLRTRWGIYKNLLAGVTTVVNHGAPLSIADAFIHVFQSSRSLHSVKFEKHWKYKLNRPYRKNLPFAIHVGEGTDNTSSAEIDELIKWNIFKKELIGIHGVAMNEAQAPFFHALVWCPASNYFLLDKTAPVDHLKQFTTIIFGTDSTLTAPWNIWDHLRLARLDKKASDSELFNMLTLSPASIWKLEDRGSMAKQQQADIIVGASKAGLKGFDAFYALNPEDLLLVMQKGNIRMFDEELVPQLSTFNFHLMGFSKIKIQNRYKYVEGNLPVLIKEIRKYYPQADLPVLIA